MDGGVQLLKGIDRVRRTLPVELELADVESLVPAYRQPAQRQSVVGARILRELFVRRHACRGQEHTVQPELKKGLLRAHQVPEVGRVEGATEDAEAH
jgi:hypothetical protein